MFTLFPPIVVSIAVIGLLINIFFWSGLYEKIEKKKKIKAYGLKPLTEEDKAQYKKLLKKASEIASKKNTDNYKSTESSNTTCPKCKDTNIISIIKQIKGGVEGEISGSSFLGCGRFDGQISGEIDTLPINKCSDCGNEWKKEKDSTYISEKDIIEDHLDDIKFYFWKIEEAKTATYNANGLGEIYPDLKTKRNALYENALKDEYRKKYIVEFWKGASINLLKSCVKQYLKDYEVDKFSRYFKQYPDIFVNELGFTQD